MTRWVYVGQPDPLEAALPLELRGDASAQHRSSGGNGYDGGTAVRFAATFGSTIWRNILQDVSGAGACRSGKPLVVSVSSVSKRLDPVGVFEAARARRQEAVFWHVPWQKVTLVGVGSVWSVTADGAACFEEVSRRWSAVLDGVVHVADDGLEVYAAAGELQFQDAEVTGRDVAAEGNDFEKGFCPDMGPGPGSDTAGRLRLRRRQRATGPWAAFGDARRRWLG